MAVKENEDGGLNSMQRMAEAEKMIKYQRNRELEVLGIGRFPEGC